MCSLKGPFLFIILSLTLNSLEATPVERLLSLALSYGTSNRQLASPKKIYRDSERTGNPSPPKRPRDVQLAEEKFEKGLDSCPQLSHYKETLCVHSQLLHRPNGLYDTQDTVVAASGADNRFRHHHLDKRKCNTATCVTQRLADFLVRSSHTIGTIYSPTNVGSNTYGKRGRELPNYLQL
ncbi:islet amyloid polypeptide [Thamnophis elegans]|uniref:islet amyloid polypeptide n=1 Tax=Thamnophis elegans TaxID=35005 RepID=UPI001377357A|nr:islet amyloid polypeptide [Thamnophis elegans]